MDDDFDHRIVVDEFFGKAHRSSHQPPYPCSEKGIHPFDVFGKGFSNPMFGVERHGAEGVPLVGQEKSDVYVFQFNEKIPHGFRTSFAHRKSDDLVFVHGVGIQQPHLLFFLAYVRPVLVNLYPAITVLLRLNAKAGCLLL